MFNKCLNQSETCSRPYAWLVSSARPSCACILLHPSQPVFAFILMVTKILSMCSPVVSSRQTSPRCFWPLQQIVTLTVYEHWIMSHHAWEWVPFVPWQIFCCQNFWTQTSHKFHKSFPPFFVNPNTTISSNLGLNSRHFTHSGNVILYMQLKFATLLYLSGTVPLKSASKWGQYDLIF